MDEIFNKLLQSDLLTEDTKQELKAAFTKQVEQATDKAKQDVTAQLHEAWVTERNMLIEALDAKVTDLVSAELNELKADINSFRDLEAEYAENLVEAKAEMAKTVKSDIKQLIEKLDAFIDIRLGKELEEFREDVNQIRKQQFGKSIFEAFVNEFKHFYSEDGSIETKLNETEQQLEQAVQALNQAEQKTAQLERKIKLESVLSPLSGKSKEVMEVILRSVETQNLEETYRKFVGRVLTETTDQKPLTESANKKPVIGKVVNGNDNQLLAEQVAEAKKQGKSLSDAERQRLRALSGLSS